MKWLFNMKMLEAGSIADHLNNFNIVTSLLSFVVVNFDDEVRALYSYAHCQKVGMV